MGGVAEKLSRISRRVFVKLALLSIAALSSYAVIGKLLRSVAGVRGGEATSRVRSKIIEEVLLPFPRLRGTMSVEEALANRRSIREYTSEPLTLEEVSQLLWAAQGISEVHNEFRTAPSAGATYPLELYLVVREGGVIGLKAGIYKYDLKRHSIRLVREGDYSRELFKAALDQEWVLNAAVNLVVTAVYRRTTRRYGDRGVRYVHMEVGHVGQNVYLQATALNLGSVVIGAFFDDEVKRILGDPPEEHPLYIISIGRPRKPYRLSPEELKKFYERQRSR